MTAFLLNRLAHGLLVLFVVSILAFVLGNVIGDPVASILGLDATQADRLALRERLHLNDPLVLRYLYYLGDLLSGQFGNSYGAQRPIADLLVERIPATIELALAALVLSVALGVPLGVLAAAHPHNRLVRVVMTSSVIGVSVPTFITGILLIAFFSLMLGWLPSFGRGEVVKIGFWSTGLLTVVGPQIADHARGEPGARAGRARRPLDPRRDAGRASHATISASPARADCPSEPCISRTPCATR